MCSTGASHSEPRDLCHCLTAKPSRFHAGNRARSYTFITLRAKACIRVRSRYHQWKDRANGRAARSRHAAPVPRNVEHAVITSPGIDSSSARGSERGGTRLDARSVHYQCCGILRHALSADRLVPGHDVGAGTEVARQLVHNYLARVFAFVQRYTRISSKFTRYVLPILNGNKTSSSNYANERGLRFHVWSLARSTIRKYYICYIISAKRIPWI